MAEQPLWPPKSSEIFCRRFSTFWTLFSDKSSINKAQENEKRKKHFLDLFFSSIYGVIHVLLSIYCKRNCESNRLDIELREEGVARIIYKMSASPQQQTNEWCRIFQLLTWISTIKLVEKYETANWSLPQGDEKVNKRTKYIYIFKQIVQCFGLKTNLLQGLKEKWK